MRGITVMELALGLSLCAVAAGAVALFALPGAAADDTDAAIRDAQRIREAAVEWRQEHPSGCPTITQLKYERALPDDARDDDPWGSRYRLSCGGDEIEVLSPGRDRSLGTKDDIVVPRVKQRS